MKDIRKIYISYAVLAFSLLFASLTPPEIPDAREIMAEANKVSRISGLEVVSTLKIYDAKGRERIRQTSMASREFDNGATQKRIIRFLSPPEVRGTGMLIYDHADADDDMWIYMPALRKTRRIVSSEKSKSFMGSEFSNADMSAPSLDDFEYTLLGSESAEGCDCWKIQSVPKNENIMNDMGFDRKITWIGKKDYVLRRAEYYNEDNELYKEMKAADVKSIDPSGKKFMATYMEMLNLENGRRSVMIMDKIQYNPDVKQDYFTLSYLEKI